MSYILADLVNAEKTQQNLNETFANVQDPATVQKVPFLEYLLTPENRGSLQQSVVIGNGQTRTVQVIYDQEVAQGRVESNVANPTCTEGAYTPPNNYQDYTIDTSINRSLSFKFARTDLETATVTPEEYFSRNLLKHVYALEVAVNNKEAASAILKAGAYGQDAIEWAGGDSTVSISNDLLTIKTRKDSSVDPFPYTARQLQEAIMYTGYMANPMIFSGSTLHSWSLDGQTFTAADYGIDLQRAFNQWGFAAMYDRGIAAAFGNQTDFLIIHPGALQLLSFTASDWTQGFDMMVGPNYVKMTIMSPRTGLPVDVLVKDDCGTITVRLWATTHLVGMPSDMFNASERYEGVTFVNKGRVSNS